MAIKRVSEKKMVVSPGTPKAPSARKTAPPQRSIRSTASVESVTSVDAASEPVAVQAIPTEAVAALAYSYWVARGCVGGSPEEDWLRAERELGESVVEVSFSKASA